MKDINTNKKKVFVAVSGGVDSSVSAALLKERGYDVTGVFIKVWQPDFLPCTWRDEMLDAMRVCAHLEIPFLMFDFENEYKKNVVDYMIAEYKKGRTPNPDVMCNKHVKFGAFLKKSIEMGADYIATGHYAQSLFDSDLGIFRLHKGIDKSKDQSYFLWTLTQDQLKKIFFPVGSFEKKEVRNLAKKFNLPTAEKKDSQGLCFIGKLDMKDFLKEFIEEKKGKVVDGDGKEIGSHDGVYFYTIGQRHGFAVNQHSPDMEPYYVVGKDIEKNIIIVSKNITEQINKKGEKTVKLENTNWVAIPKENVSYEAQTRYHQELYTCEVSNIKDKSAEVIFKNKIPLSPVGQSLVIYGGDECLGGGVIL